MNLPKRTQRRNFSSDLANTFDYIGETPNPQQGVIKNEGRIVDATFVDVPRQRNHHEENKQIKEGPEEWTQG